VSRWTTKEQQGYMHRDFPLSKDGGKGGALGLGITPAIMSMGGSSSSKAETAEPRIKLELEFLPYW
jgi:hypothetical protein